MTGVPGQMYSGSSLFATLRVYGRFDEDLGMSPKLSPDSNLQTLLQETAHNSIMNMSFAHRWLHSFELQSTVRLA